jgi:hypothetical protein
MRTFAQKQNLSQGQATSDLARRNTATSRPIHHSHLIMHLQRTLGNQAVQRLLQAKPNDLEARSSINEVTRFAHDLSQIPVFHKSPAVLHDNSSGSPAEMLRAQVLLGNRQFQQFFEGKPKKGGEKKPEPEKPPSREPCDNKCGISVGELGNTECELDLKSGLLTGKVTKEVFDKNPCTRPCVEVHEDAHAKKVAPVCTAAKKCLDAAGGDFKKQDKCLDKFQADMNALTFSTECAAYTAEEKCLSKRAKKAECKSTDGKKRWDEQMQMVKCYKGCFCEG